MPNRVAYMQQQQGFRPSTNPRAAMGAAKQRGMGASNIFGGCVQGYDADSNPVPCSDPSAVVWMDANGNAVAAGTPAAAAVPVAGVPAGSVLSYSGQWPITLSKSLDTVMSSINNFLRSQGISITSASPKVGIFAVTSFPVQLQLLITGAGFTQPSDVKSIVDHACYQATGALPYSSSISVVSIPVSAQAGQATAQGYTSVPCDPGINPGGCGQPSSASSVSSLVTTAAIVLISGFVLWKVVA